MFEQLREENTAKSIEKEKKDNAQKVVLGHYEQLQRTQKPRLKRCQRIIYNEQKAANAQLLEKRQKQLETKMKSKKFQLFTGEINIKVNAAEIEHVRESALDEKRAANIAARNAQIEQRDRKWLADFKALQ